MGEFGFDDAVGTAWDEYRTNLATRLAQLEKPDTFAEQCRTLPEGGHGPIVFEVTAAGLIGAAIDDDLLHTNPHIRAEQISGMDVLGWVRTDGGQFRSEVLRSAVNDLAVRVTATFQEIWNVLHPAFLAGGHPAPHERALDVVRLPESHEVLRTLVLDALEQMSGCPMVVDTDGDVPLPTGEVKSWLRVLPGRPTLEFFGTVVDEVPDLSAAYEFIATSTLPFTGVKLLMRGRCVVAILTVEATAFSRHNVAAGIGQWLHFVDEGRPQIIAALSADRASATSECIDDLPQALQTLIELDSDDAPLTPDQVAAICGHDHAAILDFLHTAEAQNLTWADFADRAALEHDDAEARACRDEWEAWAATARQLRAALRVVALADDADH